MTRYAATTVGVVLVAGALLSLLFRGPGDRTAIGVSAGLAVLVQLAVFSLTQRAGRGNIVAKMGIGALLRFLALVVYAVLAAAVLHLALAAALVSIATFFFLTTLIEPLLIRI